MGTGETTAARSFVIAPGEGESVWFLGTLMTVKADAVMTGGAFGLIEQELPPGFATPLHIHHREDEPFSILAGQFVFTCGERRFHAGPGSIVFLPRDVPHGFRVIGDEPARLLQFNLPGGLERFFVEAGEPAADRAQPPRNPPDVAKMAALAAGYGVEILGPLPAD